jgi:hypothetical protein
MNALRRAALVLLCGAALAGCGGGGYAEVVVEDPPPVAGLTLSLTRVGPEAIEVAWSDDPYVDTFTVFRDGHALATVTTTTLIDASVLIDETYCYQVAGYDRVGHLVAESATACVTLLP